MMLDGKYADETKSSTVWDESWVSDNYCDSGTPNTNPNADKNNARGVVTAKGGGRGICPLGWHVPTLYEWATLLDLVEGNTVFSNQPAMPSEGSYVGESAGKKLKSAGTYTGTDPGDGTWLYYAAHVGTDEYGFSAVPAGELYEQDRYRYYRRGQLFSSHIATVENRYMIPTYKLYASRNDIYHTNNARSRGKTVRCIKD
jgi:uncharacterized protein (TIGR02145 family)